MMAWLEHHSRSEQLAIQAELKQWQGQHAEASRLYHDAAEAERDALHEVDRHDKPRTWGITAVSAASLYFKSGELDRARDLAERELRDRRLPAFAAHDLRTLLVRLDPLGGALVLLSGESDLLKEVASILAWNPYVRVQREATAIRNAYEVIVLDVPDTASADRIEEFRRRFPHSELLVLSYAQAENGTGADQVRILPRSIAADDLAALVSHLVDSARTADLERLSRVAASILQAEEDEDLFDLLLEAVGDTGFRRARVFLVSASGKTLEERGARDDDGAAFGEPIGLSPEIRAVLEWRNVRVVTRSENELWPFAELLGDDCVECMCIPLVVGERVLGLIVADNAGADLALPYGASAPLGLFADQVAAAIEARRESERRHRRLAVALRILKDVNSSTLDHDEILRTTCRAACELLDVDHSALVIFDTNLEHGEVAAEYPALMIRGTRIPVREVHTQERLLRSVKPIVVPDVAAEAALGPIREILLKFGTRSAVFVPIVSKGRVLGSLSLHAIENPREFTADDISTCEMFAAEVAPAIDRAEQLEALRRTTLAITAPEDLESLCRTIIGSAVDLLRATGGGVYEYIPEQAELQLIADPDRPREIGSTIPIDPALVTRIVREGTILVSEDAEATLPGPGQWSFGSALQAPLLFRDKLIGLLYVHAGIDRHFNEDDRTLVQLFADHAAIALGNAQLHTRDEARARRLEQVSAAIKDVMGQLESTSLSDRLTLIAKHASRILDAEAAGVLLVRQRMLSLEAGHGHRDSTFERGRMFAIRDGPRVGLTGYMAYHRRNPTGRPFNFRRDDLLKHPAVRSIHSSHTPSRECFSVLAVPLTKRENDQEILLGLLRVDNKRGRNGRASAFVGFDDEDEWLIAMFAQAAEAAIESVELFDRRGRIIDCSPTAVLAADRRGRITHSNPKAAAILGYPVHELRGKPLAELYGDPAEPKRIGEMLSARPDGVLTNFTTDVRTRTGRNVKIKLTASWLLDATGRPIGSIGYFEDLRMWDQQALLLHVSNLVAEAESLDDALQDLAENVVQLLPHTFCRILLYDETQNRLIVKGSSRIDMPRWNKVVGEEIDLAAWPLAAAVFQSEEPTVFSHHDEAIAPELGRLTERLELHDAIQAVLTVTLRVPGRIVGVMYLGDVREADGTHFGEQEVAIARAIARQAAVLIDRMQSQVVTEYQTDLLRRLDDAVRTLQPSVDPNLLLRQIASAAKDLTRCEAAALLLNDPDRKDTEIVAAVGLSPDVSHRRLDWDGSVVDVTATTGRMHYTAGAKFYEHGGLLGDLDAVVTTAVTLADRVEYILVVADRLRANRLSLDAREAIERFAARASATVQTALLLTWQARMFEVRSVFDRILGYIERQSDLERILKAALNGATARYALRLNRAAILLIDQNEKRLTGAAGIGHFTATEAANAWNRDRDARLDDFDRFTEILEAGTLSETPVGERIKALDIPFGDDQEDLFTEILRRAERQVRQVLTADRLPADFVDAFDPFLPLVVVPLIAENRAVGLLVADNRFTKADPPDEEPLLALADTTALALRIAMRDGTSIATAGLGNSVGMVGRHVHELRGAMQYVLSGARTVLKADSAVLFPYDAREGRFLPDEALPSNLTAQQWNALRNEPLRPGGTAHLVLRDGWIGVADVLHGPTDAIAPEVRHQLGRIRGFEGVVLTSGKHPLGVLYLGYNRPRRFTQEDRRVTMLFAKHAAVEITNANVLSHLRYAMHTIETVARVSASGDVLGACRSIVEGMQRVLNVGPVTLYLYDARGDRFAPPVTTRDVRYPSALERRPPGRPGSLVSRMMRRRTTYIVPDVQADPFFNGTRFAREEGVRTCVVVPLKGHDRPVGVMFVNSRDRYQVGTEEIRQIELFANQAAIVIDMAQQAEQLQRASMDTLDRIAEMRDNLEALATAARTALSEGGPETPSNIIPFRKRGS